MADGDQVWREVTGAARDVVLDHPAAWPALAWWMGEATLAVASPGGGAGDPPPETRVRRFLDRSASAAYAALDRRRGYRDPDPPCDALLVPGSPRSSHARALDTLARALRREVPEAVIGVVDTPCEWLDVFSDDALVRLFPEPGFDLRPGTVARGLRAWRRLQRVVSEVSRGSDGGSDPAALRAATLRCTAVVEAGRRWLRLVRPRVIVAPDELVSPAWWIVPAARMEGMATVRPLPSRPAERSWPALSDETWVWDEAGREALVDLGAPAEGVVVVGPLRPRCVARAAEERAVARLRAHLGRGRGVGAAEERERWTSVSST